MPWTPNLTVGVAAIDEQHKIWFEKAEALFEAGKNRRSAEYIGELLEFLDSYTQEHFADEERYMLSIQYPDYALQRKAHADFLARLKTLKVEYAKSGGNILVILEANQMMINWLTQHISGMDKRIGDYARTRQ
ncbi:MAG TPA: hemerythrin family protein [Feifaniaceae bacterium]|nr:hemerythrin family protein [Feifaniaceae bacterium]